MNKAYVRINWENYPSDKTPLNEQNLNKIDRSLDEIDNRVIALEETKATKAEVAPLIKEIQFEESTGIFTVTRKNGSKFTIDTKLEKIAINFGYDPVTQKISLTLIDGTIQYIDLSALITQYEFMDTDTVSFFVDAAGKVSAIVKEGSIEERHLRPDYLAEIKVEAAKAQASATNAAKSETNAKASETAAKASQTAAKTSENNAAASATNAASSETVATQKATAAANSANAAKTSETNVKKSETNAKTSETNAASSKTAAATSATNAASSAATAAQKATDASNYATQSKSYAVGGTGTRTGENSDNSKYYYQQSKGIYDSFNSAGKVTGVKGNAESTYRNGNVNITPANIGAVNKAGDTMTGTLNSSKSAGTYLAGNQGQAIINSTAGAGAYTMLDKLNSTNGYFTDGVYQGKRLLQYTAKSIVNAGTNGITKSVTLLDESGNSSFPGIITAPVFSGNATSATNADTVDGKHASDLQNYNNLTNKPTIPAPTAVKGNAESSYRTGNVNLTAANIGALPLNPLAIEMYGTAATPTPYIDFHYKGSTADYTTRLIESASGALTCTGTFTASKVYNAVWNDYAEWFEKEDEREEFEAGDIVSWHEKGVIKSFGYADSMAVGVCSDSYGHIVGGEELKNMEENRNRYVPVGLSGRVKVKVIGKVKRGDLIISSSRKGVGVAYNKEEVIHGTIIGKSLEEKDTDDIGKVMMLIMLS